MADTTLSISLEADIRDLKAALAEMPEVGKKEATEMVNAITKQYRKATREAKKAAKANHVAFEKSFDATKDTAERTASLIGGVAGDISDSILDLGTRIADMGETIGGVGGVATMAAGGVGAFSFAVGFATKAIFEMVDSAEEAQERLAQISGAATLSPEAEASLERYRQTMLGVEASTLSTKVELMAFIAEGLEPVSAAFLGLTGGVGDFLDAARQARDLTTSWVNVQNTMAVATLGLSEVFDIALRTGLGSGWSDALADATDKGRELSDQLEDMEEVPRRGTKAMEEQRDMLVALGLAEDDSAEAIRAREEAQRAAEQAAKKAAAADQALAQVIKASTAANLSELEKVELAYQERIIAIEAAEQAGADADLASAARASAEADRLRAVTAIHDEEQAERQASIQRTADMTAATILELEKLEEEARQKRATADAEEAQRQRDGMQALAEAQIGAMSFAMDQRIMALEDGLAQERSALEGLAEQRSELREKARTADSAVAKARAQEQLEEVNREIKMKKASIKMRKRAARQAFAIQKALGIANIALQTPQMIATGAIMGGPAGAAAAGITAAVQAGMILAAKPPEFPMGRTPQVRLAGDHQLVGVDPREGIIRRRGVDAMGGPEAIRNLNEGRGAMGGSVSAQLVIGRRMMGRIVAEAVRTDPGVQSALSQDGPGIGRSLVYGG
jgi:hypothetical protein